MLNRSGYTRDGHYGSYLEYNVRDTVGKIEVGGFIIFGGGSWKGGFVRTPEPPLVTGLGLDLLLNA